MGEEIAKGATTVGIVVILFLILIEVMDWASTNNMAPEPGDPLHDAFWSMGDVLPTLIALAFVGTPILIIMYLKNATG